MKLDRCCAILENTWYHFMLNPRNFCVSFDVINCSCLYGGAPEACSMYFRVVVMEHSTKYLMEFLTAPKANGHMSWSADIIYVFKQCDSPV